MQPKRLWARWIILLLITYCLLPRPVTEAQSSPQFKNLLVELWLEYDRPEVLVIYRVELSENTSLPAQLTFRLPGYINTPHAVAVERDGALFQVNPDSFESRYEGENLWLTFVTAEPKVQLEYYDPRLLTRQDQTRQLAFEFLAPYDIKTATFAVQEPFQAEDFSLVPAASNTFIGNQGLKYNQIEVGPLGSGEIFALSATYQRNTTELSVASFGEDTSEPAADIRVITEAPINTHRTIGYTLVGTGVLLLLATVGYWWWSRYQRMKQEVAQQKVSRRPKVREKAGRRTKTNSTAGSGSSGPSRSPTEPQPPGGFCYRCGTALREEANFCHNCGAERRQT